MVVATTLKQLPPLSGNMNERLDALLKGLNDVIGALTGNLSAPITLEGLLSLSTGGVLPGTYTPTGTGVANITGTPIAYVTGWFRVGNMVHVEGRIDANATAAAGTLTRMRMTLPVASALTATSQLAGSGNTNNGTTMVSVEIYADVTNDEAEFYWFAQFTGSQGIWFTLSYQVL